eukprot:929612-Pyramimonas_sp.AAC.2
MTSETMPFESTAEATRWGSFVRIDSPAYVFRICFVIRSFCPTGVSSWDSVRGIVGVGDWSLLQPYLRQARVLPLRKGAL